MVNAEGLTDISDRTMSNECSELYDRIKAFSLDKPDAQLSFSQRLAKENGWSLPDARQAIEEYKKFAFLAVVTDHPVTPSDRVDQVWHLHLTYTRSYWEEFYGEVLQTPLHHDPTKGGESEQHKFDDWYSKTLESYEAFFEQLPPADIWPPPRQRFGKYSEFVRVDVEQNLVLPKLQVKKIITTTLSIVLTSIFSSWYVFNYQTNLDPFGRTLLAVFCTVTGWGLIQFLAGMLNPILNPLPDGIKRWGDVKWTDSGGCSGGGCGGGCCGGCGGGCGG
jgi:hypothetical protein